MFHVTPSAVAKGDTSAVPHCPDAANGDACADILVGCDGIRSVVRQQMVGDSTRYLGVFVMLGIFPSAAFPLCHQRVFQTSDGNSRLFVMP